MRADAPTGIFNISTGDGRTIKDVFDAVVDYLGVELTEPVPIVPPGADDVPAVVLDPSHTAAVLGWTAKIGFAETVRRVLAWYDAHGVSATFSHLKSPAQFAGDDCLKGWMILVTPQSLSWVARDLSVAIW